MFRNAILPLFLSLLGANLLAADVVVTRDGALLTGRIELVESGRIHLQTAYAGTIVVDQAEAVAFQVDQPLRLRLADGTVTTSRNDEIGTGDVLAAWPLGQADPEVFRAEDEWERTRMKWRVRTALDLSGREGSNQEFNLGGQVRAILANDDHILTLHGLYDAQERNGDTTEDRIVGGASYENFISRVLGWYFRSELERDRVDQIDLRSTSNGGLSYRLINEEDHRLVFRSGFGYRYTDFSGSTPSEADPTLDPALAHLYRFGERYLVQTDLRYVPSINDLNAYQIMQDTGVEIPVGEEGGFKIRFGLRNRYDSETVTDDALDTSYYTQLVMDWE